MPSEAFSAFPHTLKSRRMGASREAPLGARRGRGFGHSQLGFELWIWRGKVRQSRGKARGELVLLRLATVENLATFHTPCAAPSPARDNCEQLGPSPPLFHSPLRLLLSLSVNASCAFAAACVAQPPGSPQTRRPLITEMILSFFRGRRVLPIAPKHRSLPLSPAHHFNQD